MADSMTEAHDADYRAERELRDYARSLRKLLAVDRRMRLTPTDKDLILKLANRLDDRADQIVAVWA